MPRVHNVAMFSCEPIREPSRANERTSFEASATEYWRQSSGSARVMRYVSLLYSGFFLIQPIFEHSAEKWVWFGVVYSIFLGLYFAIPNTEGRIQQMLLAQMFALGFTYFPFNQSASGLFVYPMVMLAFMTRSMRVYLTVLAAQTVGICLETWLFHLQWWAGAMGVFFGLVVGLSNFAYSRQQRAAWLLNRANTEIEHLALVAERERIARDLHDVLGHTLTVIAIKSELANRILPVDPARAAREMQEVEQTARQALAEVREAVTGYRSDGIATEVQRARRTLAAAEVQLTTSIATLELTPVQANVLCLALREAVTNIVRHAEARTANLEVERRAGIIVMRITDDGVGTSRSEGNGLRGMRERVKKLGGTLKFERAQPAGTELPSHLPLAAEAGGWEPEADASGLRVPPAWRATA